MKIYYIPGISMENTLYIEDYSSLETNLEKFLKAEIENDYFPPFYTNQIKVSISDYDFANAPANYVSIEFNDRTYYYFIQDVQYISEEVYSLTLIMDTIVSFYNEISIDSGIIERQHIARYLEDGSINRDYIRENLSTGEFQDYARNIYNYNKAEWSYVFQYTEKLDTDYAASEDIMTTVYLYDTNNELSYTFPAGVCLGVIPFYSTKMSGLYNGDGEEIKDVYTFTRYCVGIISQDVPTVNMSVIPFNCFTAITPTLIDSVEVDIAHQTSSFFKDGGVYDNINYEWDFSTIDNLISCFKEVIKTSYWGTFWRLEINGEAINNNYKENVDYSQMYSYIYVGTRISLGGYGDGVRNYILPVSVRTASFTIEYNGSYDEPSIYDENYIDFQFGSISSYSSFPLHVLKSSYTVELPANNSTGNVRAKYWSSTWDTTAVPCYRAYYTSNGTIHGGILINIPSSISLGFDIDKFSITSCVFYLGKISYNASVSNIAIYENNYILIDYSCSSSVPISSTRLELQWSYANETRYVVNSNTTIQTYYWADPSTGSVYFNLTNSDNYLDNTYGTITSMNSIASMTLKNDAWNNYISSNKATLGAALLTDTASLGIKAATLGLAGYNAYTPETTNTIVGAKNIRNFAAQNPDVQLDIGKAPSVPGLRGRRPTMATYTSPASFDGASFAGSALKTASGGLPFSNSIDYAVNAINLHHTPDSIKSAGNMGDTIETDMLYFGTNISYISDIEHVAYLYHILGNKVETPLVDSTTLPELMTREYFTFTKFRNPVLSFSNCVVSADVYDDICERLTHGIRQFSNWLNSTDNLTSVFSLDNAEV